MRRGGGTQVCAGRKERGEEEHRPVDGGGGERHVPVGRGAVNSRRLNLLSSQLLGA